MTMAVRITKKQLLAYILDELPEGERRAVEQAYFSSPRVLNALGELTEILIDRYLDGDMNSSLRARFARTLQKKTALRQRLELARQLRQNADSPPPDKLMP